MTKSCILLRPSKFLVRYSAVPSLSSAIPSLSKHMVALFCRRIDNSQRYAVAVCHTIDLPSHLFIALSLPRAEGPKGTSGYS
jgi:hypothetical protein